MAETFPRSRLDVDRLYYSIPTRQWLSTPDGVGVHYHESKQDGLEQTGTEDRHVGIIIHQLSDW